MEQYTIAALITICTSLLTFGLAFNVGGNRRKHHANVLESTKDTKVIIANRVHLNTVENVVVFIPLLWMASIFGPSGIASVLGIIWFISRIWYAISYFHDPSKRTIPFLVGVICIVMMALLGAYGLIF